MKVFIPEAICEETHEILSKIAEVKVGKKHDKYSEDELIKEIHDVDAVLTTSRNSFTKRVIESTTKLKIIAKYGGIPKNVDIDSATKKRIVVTWTPGTYEDSVAEHTIALILELYKRTCELTDIVRNGGWRSVSTTVLHELVDKTIGIIGFGSIGSKVAQKLIGFDMKILVCDTATYPRMELIRELGIELADLETLLTQSEVVTLHVPLTEKSKGLIGEREFRKMKKSAFIINTSRGPIIDESALIKALKCKWISGAALDVFEREPPLRSNSLLSFDNVIFSPHVACWTFESLKKQALMATRDVVNYLMGRKPQHVLNPRVFDT